jgi:hypothetical protein
MPNSYAYARVCLFTILLFISTVIVGKSFQSR